MGSLSLGAIVMNIFVLDRNPEKAAEMMCDKHVVKMIVESAQMLSAAIDVRHELGEQSGWGKGTCGYPPAHLKHPCTIWTCESEGNYRWLVRHFQALTREYRKRYSKVHKMEGYVYHFLGQLNYMTFPRKRMTPFAVAITDKRWHKQDIVESYRTYYNMEKYTFAKWKLGNVPEWFSPPIE